ncbi:MAG: hypothetical protein K0S08_1970 [Gammaproteobacteria bacterium]|nr:hypothetical protein [Gammaproteobacteria bacterium]
MKINLLILTLGISWQALAQSAALEPGIQELKAAQAQQSETVPQAQQTQIRTAIHLSNLLYSSHLWCIQDNTNLQAKPLFHLCSVDFGLFGFIGLVFLLIGLIFYYSGQEAIP